jgi:hypothetical protein
MRGEESKHKGKGRPWRTGAKKDWARVTIEVALGWHWSEWNDEKVDSMKEARRGTRKRR